MATQTDIQQLIQGLAPLTVNNGNPNTVYNTPASPFANPAAGLPANWTLGNLPSYKEPNWQQLAAQAQGPMAQFRGWNLGAAGNPPPVIPGTTPPPTGRGNPPPIGQTGGPNPPLPHIGGGNGPGNGPNGGLGPNDGRIRGGSGNGWGILGLPPGDISTNFTADPGHGSLSKAGFLGGLSSLGTNNLNVDLGSFGQQLASTSLGKALGVNQNGSFNLMQALDWVLPGNLYMSQTGQTNWANLIPALFSKINPLIGFGVAKLMDYFGAKYQNTDDAKLNFLQRMLKHRYQKNQANRHPNGNGGGGGGDRNGYGGGTNGGGTFIGGSYGTGFGGNPSITIGGPGSTIGVTPGGLPGGSIQFGGTWGNPMSMFDFHPSDTK